MSWQRIFFQLSIALLGLSAWGNTSYDPDLGWHLFGGAWIVAHQQLPFEDFINAFRLFWHDYHWLAQIMLYAIFKVAELDGLRFLVGITGALLGLILFSIANKTNRSEANPLRSFFWAALGLMIIRPYLLPRPQIFSFLIIAAILSCLLSAPRRRHLLAALAGALCCINMHVNWILIPLIWFSMRVIPAFLLKRERLFSSIGFSLLIFVGFSDPYVFIFQDPWIAYRLLIDYATLSPELQKEIGEMRSIYQATAKEIVMISAFIFTGSCSLIKGHVKEQSSTISLFFFGSILLFSMLKFMPIFAIFALPAAIIGTVEIESLLLKRRSALPPRIAYFATVTSLIVCSLLATIGSPFLYDSNRNLWAFLPRQECERIAEISPVSQDKQNPVRILTHFNEGGWCRWFAFQRNPSAQILVTTDGRTQDFPEDMLRQSFEIFEGRGNWIKSLEEWQPDYALVPRISSFTDILGKAPEWQLLSESRFHKLFAAAPKDAHD
jgi:hypothetical protein